MTFSPAADKYDPVRLLIGEVWTALRTKTIGTNRYFTLLAWLSTGCRVGSDSKNRHVAKLKVHQEHKIQIVPVHDKIFIVSFENSQAFRVVFREAVSQQPERVTLEKLQL